MRGESYINAFSLFVSSDHSLFWAVGFGWWGGYDARRPQKTFWLQILCKLQVLLWKIFLCRSSGSLLSLDFERGTEIVGWDDTPEPGEIGYNCTKMTSRDHGFYPCPRGLSSLIDPLLSSLYAVWMKICMYYYTQLRRSAHPIWTVLSDVELILSMAVAPSFLVVVVCSNK